MDHTSGVRRIVQRILVGLSSVLLVAAMLAPAVGASETAAPAGSEHITYVAIGASDTLGVGATIPHLEGWVPRLATQLGSDVEVHNLGVSGSLLHDALDQQLSQALEVEADVVTIWLAVNDFNAFVPLSRYTADLDAMLAALRARSPNAHIIIGNIPDVTLVTNYASIDPYFLSWIRWGVGRWNVSIAQVAARHDATVVDLFSGWTELLQNPEYISWDGFHPSSLGYARLAEAFHESLLASGFTAPVTIARSGR